MKKSLYFLALILFALVQWPRLLWKGKKVKERVFPEALSDLSVCIWIHAVSVGEVKAVAPLAKRLQGPLIVSTMTETGLAEARRVIPQAAAHLILPIDLSPVMKRLMGHLKLSALILSETDFWWNFMRQAKARGAQIILVNGKLSDSSLKMWSRFRGLWPQVFPLIDHFFLQSEEQKSRFLSLGIPEAKIAVTGNLKFESALAPSSDLHDFSAELGIQAGKIVVFGSTHEEEEGLLVQVIKDLLKKKDVQVLVVPRHPERFAPVRRLMEPFPKVTVVERMGVLQKCYELAEVAVVCGSFVEGLKGHNILEPLFFKRATLFGPYMEGQRDLVQAVLGAGGGRQVEGVSLADSIVSLLESDEERLGLGERGFELMRGSRRGLDDILQFLVASK